MVVLRFTSAFSMHIVLGLFSGVEQWLLGL